MSLEEFRGKRVAVIGAARSGVAAALALQRVGAVPLLSDSKSANRIEAGILEEIEGNQIASVFGAQSEAAVPTDTQLVVTSPGVPVEAPILQLAISRRIPIWSEIELAFRLAKAPILATTGTNGKTTTTLLAAAMLQQSGIEGVVCGNISADDIKRTLVEAAEQTAPDGVLVAEISSFQLEWVEKFAPRAAILTNITPDHLNRHKTLETYAETKARLFAAQSSQDRAIFNLDDPIVQSIGGRTAVGNRFWFSVQTSPPASEAGAWLENKSLRIRETAEAETIKILDVEAMPPTLPGKHNIANVLAAAAAALFLGATLEGIVSAVQNFKGVPHRMEWVADIAGVRYINNSMCTNTAAAMASLEALQQPVLLIAGGADKDLEFQALTPILKRKVRHAVLIGSVADKMEKTFRADGYDQISRATTLEEAVAMANRQAQVGDIVIISPGCASFDMFRDFEARGVAFREAVQQLKETKA